MASPEESDVALKMKNPARPCPTARPSRGSREGTPALPKRPGRGTSRPVFTPRAAVANVRKTNAVPRNPARVSLTQSRRQPQDAGRVPVRNPGRVLVQRRLPQPAVGSQPRERGGPLPGSASTALARLGSARPAERVFPLRRPCPGGGPAPGPAGVRRLRRETGSAAGPAPPPGVAGADWLRAAP